MQLGAIFPQTEIGADPAGVRDFAQAAEDLGYEHLLVFDHVLGADASKRESWERPYSSVDMFHEPFVLFGYLGAITQKLEFVTGVLILGQRQTALVAKQAAEVDVLTGGRLRLGIGVGWNDVEYEGLNEDFTNRGRRSAEQIEVMRLLWTQEVVDYHGRYHNITHAGINPRPAKSIPVWFGGGAPQVVRRIGRMGDGWFPQSGLTARAPNASPKCARSRSTPAATRPTSASRAASASPPTTRTAGQAGGELGRGGRNAPVGQHHARRPEGPDQHIEAIRRFKDTVSA